MKIHNLYIFTKTFKDHNEMSEFFNNCVGDKYYYQIRPKHIYVNELTIVVMMRIRSNGGYWRRKEILLENGFLMMKQEWEV